MILNLSRILLVVIALNCFMISLFSQEKENRRTILEVVTKSDSLSGSQLPLSEEKFSPTQDSAFKQAISQRIPTNIIVQNHLGYSDRLYAIERNLRAGKGLDDAIENIKNTPREFYTPTGNEIVQRQIAIDNAFYVPFVNTLPKVGFKIPVSAIAALLGMVEDVSPEISYTLDFTAKVEVVVYSIKAVVIATIFNGVQPPGSYKLTWNGRDEKGKKMESGDYIAEVRIGNERYVRKRIVIP